MTPRRLWLNKVPTQCDVVIEFSGANPHLRLFCAVTSESNNPRSSSPISFADKASEEVLRFLLAKLKTSPPAGLGLSVLMRPHESTKLKALYLTAPINV